MQFKSVLGSFDPTHLYATKSLHKDAQSLLSLASDTGNYNMILQMQTRVDNQVKTMISHITKDHIHQMSSHINTKCENGASH